MLQFNLQCDFYNVILIIKYKLYISCGSAPPPPLRRTKNSGGPHPSVCPAVFFFAVIKQSIFVFCHPSLFSVKSFRYLLWGGCRKYKLHVTRDICASRTAIRMGNGKGKLWIWFRITALPFHETMKYLKSVLVAGSTESDDVSPEYAVATRIWAPNLMWVNKNRYLKELSLADSSLRSSKVHSKGLGLLVN